MRLPLLILHISGGILGLLSGALAMIYRKGSRGHRLAGDVFVVAMLTMGMCGSTLALMKHQMGNVFGGVLTFYMITTAWLAGRRREGVGALDWAALGMALTIGASMFTLGMRVVKGIDAKQEGVPLAMYFVMGSIALLAATGDLRMLLRGGISGTARLSRHLWRMCFGLFIATGSFFLGQQQVFPASWRGSAVWFVPALLPLPLMIFWLIRVRVASAYKKRNWTPANAQPSMAAN
jgi:uncharacterized membrane protein